MKEVILDYPLAEGLGYDRPSVIDTEFLPYKLAMSVCGGGRDPVNHTVGKGAIFFQPIPNRGIPQLGKRQ